MKYLIITILAVFVTVTGAFKCYQCEYYAGDNETDSNCNKEPVPESLLTDCVSEANPTSWQCVKKSGKTVEDEEKYVIRSCVPGKAYENTCKESDGLDSPYGTIEKAFKCYCNADGCNGAPTLLTSTFIFPLMGFLGYFFH